MKHLVLLIFLVLTQYNRTVHAQTFTTEPVPGSTKDVSLVCTRYYNTSGLIGDKAEMVGFMPIPPTIMGQKDTFLKVQVEGAADFSSTEIRELSPQHRPFNRVVIHPFRNGGMIKVTWTLSAKITALRAVRSTTRLAADMKHVEIPNLFEFGSSMGVLRSFAQANQLIAYPNESPVDFEWRVLRPFHHKLTYVYQPGQDHRFSYLSSLAQPIPTDCGGYADLSVAVALANGINANSRVGRWVIPAKGSTPAETGPHVQYQFYDPFSKKDWIVDPSCSRDSPTNDLSYFFGNWDNNFMTVMLGSDAEVDTLHFGVQPIPWGQRPSVWIADCHYGETGTEVWKVYVTPVQDDPNAKR